MARSPQQIVATIEAVRKASKTERGGGRLRGITELLKAAFYPDYRYTGKSSGDEDAALRAAGARVRKRAGGKTRKGGMSRGSKLDNVVRGLVERTITKASLRTSVGRDGTTVMQALRAKNLQPLVCQVPCMQRDWGLWTSIDIVAFDVRRKRIVLVEQKSGYDSYYKRSNAMMHHELTDTPNSPYYQHMLQIAVARVLFEAHYGLPADTVVARVTGGGVFFYPLEDGISARARAIVARVSSRST